MVKQGMPWNFILTWLVCVFLSHNKAPKYCFCATYQNTIFYCIVPFSCAINCYGYVNICDNWQNENLVMVFFHSNTRCDLLFQESIIFFTSYQVTVNLLICSVYQSLKEESGSLRKHVRFSSVGFKISCLWAVTGRFWSSFDCFFFSRSIVSHCNRELKQRCFWATDINRKWAFFSFSKPWRYRIYIAKCLNSYRDDLPKNLFKIMAQECKTSTSSWRVSLKSVAA